MSRHKSIANRHHLVAGSIAVLGIFSVAESGAQEVSCGLGPPPGSPLFAEHIEKQERQRQALGYLLLCDESFARYDFVAEAARAAQRTQTLLFTPTNLATSRFASLTQIGSIPDVGSNQQGYRAVRRLYRTESGVLVTIREWDMTAAGGGIRFMGDYGAVTVRGKEARLTVVKTPTGKGHAEITWVEGGRLFEVTVGQVVTPESALLELKAFAASLP